jgi:hypothetical protein
VAADELAAAEVAGHHTRDEGVPLGGGKAQAGSIRTRVLGVTDDDFFVAESSDLDTTTLFGRGWPAETLRRENP